MTREQLFAQVWLRGLSRDEGGIPAMDPTDFFLSLMACGVPVQTRLREGDCGDLHDCLGPLLLGLPDSLHMDGVATALESLERDRMVLRTERVHPYDPGEYVITWTLAPGHHVTAEPEGAYRWIGAATRQQTAEHHEGRRR